MLKNMYLLSPAFFQNLAITLYGMKTYYERFSGKVPETYEVIDFSFSEPTQRQFDLQEERLQVMLKHCADNVPFYRKFLSGVDLNKINSKNLSEYLPKISKRDIVENISDFITTDSIHKPTLKLSTSGSSGIPLTIYSSKKARRINYKFYEGVLNEYGACYRSRSTTIAGRLLYRGNSKSPARYDYYNRTQYLSAYSVSKSNIRKYIIALNQWKPLFIDSYPSTLFEIQRLARQENLCLTFSPKFILTSSETMTPSARKEMESYFNAPVVDHYGCTEMAVSAFSRGRRYYADPRYAVLELERMTGNAYSLVTTGLLNLSMPLIRYEIGDLVVTDDPENPYMFDSIEGRVDDSIITPEGKKVGRLGPAFKDIEGIAAIQIVQEAPEKIEVKVVLLEKYMEQFNESELIDSIKSLTSDDIEIIVTYPEQIEKGKNGKVKTVVSKVSHI